MKLTVHHVALKVADLKKCEHFYTKVLGLQVIDRHNDKLGKPRSIWFSLGDTILMLELTKSKMHTQKKESCGWHLLALKISLKERKKWKAKLKKFKIEILNETPFSIYFLDPENNRLALSHYPENYDSMPVFIGPS